MAGNVLCPGLLISFRVFFTVFYLLVCYFFFLNHIVSLVPGECKLHENLHFVIVYCGFLGWYGEEGPGQRNLMGYSPWGQKESDTTK